MHLYLSQMSHQVTTNLSDLSPESFLLILFFILLHKRFSHHIHQSNQSVSHFESSNMGDRSTIIYCGFKNIIIGNHFLKPTIVKGKNLLQSGHVHSVKEIVNGEDSTISARCVPQTSVTGRTYRIEIKVTEQRTIKEASCDCQAGITGQCKHVAGTVQFVNEDKAAEAGTSKPRNWGVPSTKSLYSQGCRIKDVFPDKTAPSTIKPLDPKIVLQRLPNAKCAMVRTLKSEDVDPEKKDKIIEERRKQLENKRNKDSRQRIRLLTEIINPGNNITLTIPSYTSQVIQTGLKLVIKPAEKVIEGNIPLKEFYTKKVLVQEEEIIDICDKTVSQSGSPQWFEVRRIRISSSNAHKVITRSMNYDKLAANFQTSFSGNEATHYGLKMEKTAKSAFMFDQENEGHKVVLLEVGVLISMAENWLCSSPDGICEIDGLKYLLEVKCPFKRKGELLVDSNKKESFVDFLEYDNEELRLKPGHSYYSQVQISMYCANLKSCKFVVYSSKDRVCVTVPRDIEFLCMTIPKLKWFYFQYLLPHVAN